MQSPRFPQPAIEALLEYAGWRDVLNALSVDRREAPARRWLINATGQATFDDPEMRDCDNKEFVMASVQDRLRDYMAFVCKYPGCLRRLLRRATSTQSVPGVQRLLCVGSSTGMNPDNVFSLFTPLPETIVYLRITFGTFSPIPGFSFPRTLRHLELYSWGEHGDMNCLAASAITHLTLGAIDRTLTGRCLPSGLTHLIFRGRGWRAIEHVELPDSLQYLSMPHDTHGLASRQGKWPSTLTYYHIHGLDARAELPPALTHLKVLGPFWIPATYVKWPKGLTHLCMRERHLGNSLPTTLQHLSIVGSGVGGRRHVCGLEDIAWPPALRRLVLPGTMPENVPRPPEGCVVSIGFPLSDGHW